MPAPFADCPVYVGCRHQALHPDKELISSPLPPRFSSAHFSQRQCVGPREDFRTDRRAAYKERLRAINMTQNSGLTVSKLRAAQSFRLARAERALPASPAATAGAVFPQLLRI
jgi:hypothetical protein